MKKQEDLYNLVHSLDKTEKRHFRLFAQRHRKGSNNNVALFGCLEELDTYDSVAVRQALAGRKLVRQLTFAKYYLYRLLLKSLHLYHASSSVEVQLAELLHQVRLLYDKELTGQACRLLEDARALAEKYERFTCLLDIAGWEQKLYDHYLRRPEDAEAVFAQEKKLTAKILNRASYTRIINHMRVLIRERGETIRSLAEMRRFKSITAIPRLPLSFEAQRGYWFLNFFRFHMTGNYGKAHRCISKVVELFENRPHFIRLMADEYLNALNDRNFNLIFLDRYREIMSNLARQHSLRFGSRRLSAMLFAYTYNLELIVALRVCRPEQAAPVIPAIEKGLRGFQISTGWKLHICYNAGLIFFIMSNYGEAARWIEKARHELRPGVRHDVQCFILLLDLLIHYEMGYTDILEYKIAAAYRFLKKKESLYRFESALLGFLKNRLPRITSPAGLKNACVALKRELESIAKDPYEEKALQYFDFIGWLESKISQRPFAEIVREKAFKASH